MLSCFSGLTYFWKKQDAQMEIITAATRTQSWKLLYRCKPSHAPTYFATLKIAIWQVLYGRMAGGKRRGSGVGNGVIGCIFYAHAVLAQWKIGSDHIFVISRWNIYIIIWIIGNKTLFFLPFQRLVEILKSSLLYHQWLQSRTVKQKAIKHQQTCIIPVMTSACFLSASFITTLPRSFWC